MVRLRVYDLDGATSALPRLRSYKVTATGDALSGIPRLRVQRLTGTGVVPSTPRLRIAKVNASGVASLVLNPITDLSGIEAESIVQVTATVQSGLPDGWTWRQISGPTVSLTAVGSMASFIAPSSMSTVTVVLGITATSASVVSAERTVSVQVLPQTLWNYIGGTWRGAPSEVWL